MNYSDLLKNKTIAIIGPSSTALSSLNGEKIDSCDLVVRLRGNTLPSSEKMQNHIGKRTDIVYTNFDNNFDDNLAKNLLKNDIKYIRSTRCSEDIGNSWNYYEKILKNNKFFYSCPDKKKYYSWHEKMKCSPHSGFCAILDLISYDIKSLHIFGYSFYKQPVIQEWAVNNMGSIKKYNLDYKEVDASSQAVCEKIIDGKKNIDIGEWKQEKTHNNMKEILFFKHVVLNNDDRVFIDDSLKTILNNL